MEVENIAACFVRFTRKVQIDSLACPRSNGNKSRFDIDWKVNWEGSETSMAWVSDTHLQN